MSDANKDEADKCIHIAQRAREDGNLDKALKFAEKSKQLYSCERVDRLLKEINAARANGAGTSSSTARPSAGPNLRPRGTAGTTAASSSRSDAGTPAQRELVKKILAAKGDYYGVLGVARSADDDDIKKAYRKLALKLHPDKCQARGAEEAFKEVSKAFSCLADTQKRSFYDRTGHEDMASASAATRSRGMHAEEINPEEIFNAFFGNMMFGMGPMGMGHQFRHGDPFMQQRRRQQQRHAQQPPQGASMSGLTPAFLAPLVNAFLAASMYQKVMMVLVLLQALPFIMGLLSWTWWLCMLSVPVYLVCREVTQFEHRSVYAQLRRSQAVRQAVSAAQPTATAVVNLGDPAAKVVATVAWQLWERLRSAAAL